MKSLRVVFADDSAIIRDRIREVLSREPGLIALGEAANGAEAFWLYYKMRPDLLILDLSMPSPDGVEVLQEIRKHDQETKIIIFTADPGMMLKKSCLEAGANYYFDKSDLASLVKVCHHLLEEQLCLNLELSPPL